MLVDEKEVINMPFFIEYVRYAETYKRKENESDKDFEEIYEEVNADFAEKGLYYPGDFGAALDEFLSINVKDALFSNNYLVRMIALLDRRTGKRTLEKIKLDVSDFPQWLQYFYRLRIESDFGKK